MGEWHEQWQRVLRWRNRLNQLSEARDPDPDEAQDHVYAFFQNVWHLKDWLKNDPGSGMRSEKVESFANGCHALKVAADLCNGSKHLTLTHPRANGARLAGRDIRAVVGGGVSYRFRILVHESQRDAFELAQECVSEWESFLTQDGLLYPRSAPSL